jgi:3-hydroxybutyryl-CoA dehydratase
MAGPVVAHYIDDLEVGQSASYTRTVTEADVEQFGAVSGDLNPLHFDEEYAKTTIFRGRIAHGVLSLSYISGVLGTKLPGAGSIFIGATVRFKAPVRIGDTVTAICTVKEINRQRNRVMFDCVCRVGDTVVVEAETQLMVPARKAEKKE